MTSSNETDFEDMSNLKKLQQLRRKREREELIEQQKENNHWNFIAGELVAKYLKDVLNITVHKGHESTAKNAAAFEPLENICKYLAAHKEFTAQIALGGDD